jgi:hypothetical protein
MRHNFVTAFAATLSPEDIVVVEATGNAAAVAGVIGPYVKRVVIANPIQVPGSRAYARALARFLSAGQGEARATCGRRRDGSHLLPKKENYAWTRPALQARKLRTLRLKAGHKARRGQKGTAHAYNIKGCRKQERRFVSPPSVGQRRLS